MNSTVKPSQYQSSQPARARVLLKRAEAGMLFLMLWVVVDLFLIGSIAIQGKNWFWYAVGWLLLLTVAVSFVFLRIIRRYAKDTGDLTRVAEREQGERKQMGELLSSLFEVTPDAITLKDADGRYLHRNQSAAQIFTAHHTDYRGKLDAELVPPDSATNRRAADLRLIKGELSVTYEESLTLPGRGETTWLVRVDGLRDADTGRLKVIFTSYRDISERKALTERIRESEESFSAFFRSSAVGTVISALEQGTLVEVNNALAQMLGYTRDELIGRSVLDLGLWLNPDSRQAMVAQIQRSGQVHQWETSLRCKNGTSIEVLLQGDLVSIREARYFRGTVTDITAINAAREALKQKEQQYRALFENMLAGAAYGVLAETAQGADIMLIEANSRLEELLGRAARELTGAPLSEVYPALRETNPELEERIRRVALHEGRPERFQSWLPQTNRWLEFCVFSGNARSFIITADDITERRRYEDEILRLNDQLKQRVTEQTHSLEAAVQDMETFIYTVSARMYSALQGIRLDLDVALSQVPEMTPVLAAQFKQTQRHAREMKVLLDGAVAYLCASTMPVVAQLVDVQSIVQRLCDDWAKTRGDDADKSRPVIAFNIKPLPQITGVPLIVHAIFNILIDNACQFTAQQQLPEIEIGVQQGVDTTFYVKDNGVGFPQAEAHRLFRPFERLPNNDHLSAGMGLAIARRLVERHTGAIWATSVEGEGATFFVSLGPPPLAHLDAADPLFMPTPKQSLPF